MSGGRRACGRSASTARSSPHRRAKSLDRWHVAERVRHPFGEIAVVDVSRAQHRLVLAQTMFIRKPRMMTSASRIPPNRHLTISRLWRQAPDGPSDGLVGSVVRDRSRGARVELIENRSAQPITRGPRVSIRHRRRRQDGRLARPNQRAFGKRNFAARDSEPHSGTKAGRPRQIAATDRTRPR